MTGRLYALLFLLGFGLVLGISFFLPGPGYMDAEYYFAGGIRLADASGFSEPFLWNYLDDPEGLPHPSHAYWMPLASLLAALGLKLAGSATILAGRFPFLLAAGLIPPLTAALCYSLASRRDLALTSGLLAIFPGYYLTFLAVTDTFGLYMLLGGLFFLVAGPGIHYRVWRYPLLGLIAGLMHLARADGILWLGMALLVALFEYFAQRKFGKHRHAFLPSALLALAGYLLVMGPWMLRNLAVFGSPLAPGGSRALWLTSYDELFSYPAGILTPGRFLASGLAEILRVRLEAVGGNLVRALAIQGQVFLGPLALAGLWRVRQDRRSLLGALAWLLTFLAMSVAFPFQGVRGGYFHSGAALQPLIWAAAPVGLEVFLNWGVRRRGWKAQQARTVFRIGLVALSGLMTIFLAFDRAILPALQGSQPSSQVVYTEVRHALDAEVGEQQAPVMVNNPPGYFLATGKPSIVIPNGDIDTLLAAGRRYGARYIILEFNHPSPLDDLYNHPGDREGLKYLRTVNGTHIFEITSSPE